MSYRLTLGLLAVLVALAGVVYWTESRPEPAAQSRPVQVMSFLSSDATRLEATALKATVVVERDDQGKWRLKQPEDAEADQRRVDSLLSLMGALTASRTIESPGDLGEYGLAEPKVEAKITLADGKSLRLLVGDKSPDGSAYYARSPEGNAVYLVPSYLGGDLERLLTAPPKALPTPTQLPTQPPIPSPSATP